MHPFCCFLVECFRIPNAVRLYKLFYSNINEKQQTWRQISVALAISVKFFYSIFAEQQFKKMLFFCIH